MPEYIDRKKIRYHFEVGEDTAIEGRSVAYKTTIDSMPTEDVVPVVRCKDCKYYVRPSIDEDNYYCLAEHTGRLFSPNKNDYCSCGERK